ncbi:MAG: holo-ACP synthase [Magnetococcales bacterium]|nr:holo-ACP synthase [Magnetococcales bacterium]
MIVGIGTDLVAIDRIGQSMQRHADRFLVRVFTAAEQALCAQRRATEVACFAKRFAAKEAMVKALGTGMRDGIWFTDVEVLNDALGRPVITLKGAAARRLHELAMGHGFAETRIHLSLADDGGMAMAHVVVEGCGQD